MGNQFSQFPWKGQFSLSLVLLVTKLIALGIAPSAAAAPTVARATQSTTQNSLQAGVSLGQPHLDITPEGTLSASEWVLPVPAANIAGEQPQVDIVQTLEGTLVAQGPECSEADLLAGDASTCEDIENDY